MSKRFQRKRAQHGKRGLLCLAACALVASSVHATLIQFAGSDVNLGDGWRTPSVPKARDTDGDNRYGTEGYWLFRTGSTGYEFSGDPFEKASISAPAYASLSAAGANFSLAVGAIFPAIDDPDNAPSDFYSGTAGRNGIAEGSEQSLFELSFTGFAPAQGVRVGVFVNNSDADNPANIRFELTSDTGITADVDLPANQTQVDFFFFDITDISAGDTFTFYATDTVGGNAEVKGIGGFTVDSLQAVPEPSALVLMLLGGLPVLHRVFRGRIL